MNVIVVKSVILIYASYLAREFVVRLHLQSGICPHGTFGHTRACINELPDSMICLNDSKTVPMIFQMFTDLRSFFLYKIRK